MVERPPTPACDGPRTSVGELTDRLQDLILSGTLAGGSWLRQERLAGEFGVSRTPVREALRALAARGLVELHDNRGAIVCVPTAREIREAYAVRAELEGYAAELAAEWACDSDLDRLTKAARLFERLVASEVAKAPVPAAAAAARAQRQAPERVRAQARVGGRTPAEHGRPEWQEANDHFHVTILDAAGNRRLKATIESLHTSFPRNLTWSALSGHALLLAENVEQHRQILRAIEDRDPAGARAGMVAHVRRAGDLVAHRIDRLATGDPDG